MPGHRFLGCDWLIISHAHEPHEIRHMSSVHLPCWRNFDTVCFYPCTGELLALSGLSQFGIVGGTVGATGMDMHRDWKHHFTSVSGYMRTTAVPSESIHDVQQNRIIKHHGTENFVLYHPTELGLDRSHSVPIFIYRLSIDCHPQPCCSNAHTTPASCGRLVDKYHHTTCFCDYTSLSSR